MIDNGELVPAVEVNGDPDVIPELTEWIEEADEKIILPQLTCLSCFKLILRVYRTHFKCNFLCEKKCKRDPYSSHIGLKSCSLHQM